MAPPAHEAADSPPQVATCPVFGFLSVVSGVVQAATANKVQMSDSSFFISFPIGLCAEARTDFPGSQWNYSHTASAGSDIRIASGFPPVINPNRVPRSYSRLNSA